MNFVASFLAIFSPRFSSRIVGLMQTCNYRLDKYLAAFWLAGNLQELPSRRVVGARSNRSSFLELFMIFGSLAQLVFGAILLGLGASGDLAGGIYFGIAAIISFPLVWAHLLVIPVFIIRLPSLSKEIGRQIVLAILVNQVKQLREHHDFKIIAVAGSVGKTSTKFAIAQTLESKLKVAWQSGNYNDAVTVPLVFFNEPEPSLFNVVAWLKVFVRNRRKIKDFPYQAVVLELGTEGPGQLKDFEYLKPDIGVLTAIAPEHIEFFGNLDNVAAEELTLAHYSKKILINADLCDKKYLTKLKNTESYGYGKVDYRLSEPKYKDKKQSFSLSHSGKKMFSASVGLLSKNQLYGAAAASAVAGELGFSNAEIKKAISRLEPAAGRMQPLAGIKNSTILDDTYNSAPEAAIAALETLYKINAPQKIAILGSMNELGDYSPEAHRLVGEFCNPKKLDQIVTIGKDAKEFLAPIAEKAGCKVKSFDDPVAAGKFVKKQLKSKALVLAKGSQNGVFAEEAVKILLKNKKDASRLVRQSDYWLGVKSERFKMQS